MGASAALLLAGALVLDRVPGERAAWWTGGILLDDGFRDGLRIDGEDGRMGATRASDAMLGSTLGLALLVDSVLVPLINDDAAFAWNASATLALSMGLTMFVGGVVKNVVRRRRPFAEGCESDPSSPNCSEPNSSASFYSLHSGVAFTAAGHSCALHLERNLYGDGVADGVSCVASLAAASTTALLRVAADVHYLSDIVIGAAIGFLTGYLLPLALVPRTRRAAAADPELDGGVDTRSAPAMPIVFMPTYAPGPEGQWGQVGLSASGLW